MTVGTPRNYQKHWKARILLRLDTAFQIAVCNNDIPLMMWYNAGYGFMAKR